MHSGLGWVQCGLVAVFCDGGAVFEGEVDVALWGDGGVVDEEVPVFDGENIGGVVKVF